MGMMTEVSILNDYLHEIEQNPGRFVEELLSAIHSGKEVHLHGLGTTVLPSHHADDLSITLAHRNSVTQSYTQPEGKHLLLHQYKLLQRVKNVLKLDIEVLEDKITRTLPDVTEKDLKKLRRNPF
jgi:hypothetical protein